MLFTGQNNFRTFQGDSFSFDFLVSGENGPLDLSGYSASGGIKYSYGSSGYLTEFVINPTSGQTGVYNVSIPYTGTQKLPVGNFPYQIEGLSSADIKNKLLFGYVSIYPEIVT